MGRDRAAYMREYRALRKRAHRAMEKDDLTDKDIADVVALGTASAQMMQDRILELEAEVRHLKAELAKRPTLLPPHRRPTVDVFGDRPFTPAPKPSQKTARSGK